METTTALSLGQAARLTGLGKTTLARAIRAGRLSATRTETGGYSIEPCELARVFPTPITRCRDRRYLARHRSNGAVGDCPRDRLGD